MRIAIVGAGFTGLTCAYRLSQKGHKVSVFEKEKFCGGLATGFKEKGWNWSLEYFFHHLFTSDSSARNLISELGLSEKLFFVKPKTSIFYKDTISQFDSPLSVLTFPHLSLPDKIRTGLITFYLKIKNNWRSLENTTAFAWLEKYYGKRSFETLWKPLLEAKFGQEAKKISMSWFWARIKKRSQKLGYLEGGFQVLIDKLSEKIKENGGKIYLNHPISSLSYFSRKNNFDKIIITTPTQMFFKTKIPKMLGALNLILVLKEKFLTDNTYWLNVNQPNFPFVAVVEHTNFVDKSHYGDNHILYIGGYYPQNHRYFKMKARQIFAEFKPYLKKINPDFDFLSSVVKIFLSSNLFAQPVMPINYSQILSNLKKTLPEKIILANMQTIYPWDRGVNYAIETGEKVAETF